MTAWRSGGAYWSGWGPALAQAAQVPSDKLTAVVKPLCGADSQLCAEAAVRSGAVAPASRRPGSAGQMNLCNSGFAGIGVLGHGDGQHVIASNDLTFDPTAATSLKLLPRVAGWPRLQ